MPYFNSVKYHLLVCLWNIQKYTMLIYKYSFSKLEYYYDILKMINTQIYIQSLLIVIQLIYSELTQVYIAFSIKVSNTMDKVIAFSTVSIS